MFKIIFVIAIWLFSVSRRSNALICMYPRMGGVLFGFGNDFAGDIPTGMVRVLVRGISL